MKSREQSMTGRAHAGFSLVEVVMAVGIVSFAIVTLLALLGSAFDAGGSVTERREAIRAMDALRHYLNEEVDFDTAYEWAQNADGQWIAYVTYHAEDDGTPEGTPKAGEQSVRSKWFEYDNTGNIAPSVYADYEDAREGRWIIVRLLLNEVQNPMEQSELPSDAPDYPHAYLAFKAEIYEAPLPLPIVDVSAIDSPIFTVPVMIVR